jgi:hypothetical protein
MHGAVEPGQVSTEISSSGKKEVIFKLLVHYSLLKTTYIYANYNYFSQK